MNTIDYIYRFDPKNPSVKPPPPDTEAARKTLEDGNRMFANWMESCRTSSVSTGEVRYVVQCNGLEVGMNRAQGQLPKQAPFAVVVGCSGARVPLEMLFGQGFNDLFVIRVAGNVLGDLLKTMYCPEASTCLARNDGSPSGQTKVSVRTDGLFLGRDDHLGMEGSD